VYVGGSTAAVIVGNKLLPGLGDRYLARTGYESQLTQEREEDSRPDNLFEPVSGDHGAHGRFDAQAHASSIQMWATTHRRGLAAVSLAALGAAATMVTGALHGASRR
jgi:hypothetical protein